MPHNRNNNAPICRCEECQLLRNHGIQNLNKATIEKLGVIVGDAQLQYMEEFKQEEEDDDSQIVWDPFEDELQSNTSEKGVRLLRGAEDWEQKSQIAVGQILGPFLSRHSDRFGDWPIQELDKIFEEAEHLPQQYLSDGTRYFGSGEKRKPCTHEAQCFCYFEATLEAGIPGFSPAKSSRTQITRHACLAFMHNLVVKLLIFLSADEKLCRYEKRLLIETINWTNPNNEFSNSVSDEDDGEYVRYRYLVLNSALKRLSKGVLKSDWDEEFENNSFDEPVSRARKDLRRVPNDLLFLQLCGTIGRRSLSLGVCRQGLGTLFVKKEPISCWNLSEIVRHFANDTYSHPPELGTYILKNPRNVTEHPRYPTRVINTETLEFEEDQMLFQKKYAILSHTWTQRGKEVTFENANEVLAKKKVKRLQFKIERLKDLLRFKIEGFKNQPRQEARARAELEDLETLESQLRGIQEVLPKREEKGELKNSKKELLSHGESKLCKAVSAAKALGFTYLWVDNCCIDKPNNTELVEAISSMGDWYRNAEVCLVYLDDLKVGGLPELSEDDELPRVLKTRWATRGWTLQEIVMAPNAVFYNTAWKKVADTRKGANRTTLAKICGIPESLLCCRGKPNVAASVILKLAAKRKTFKPEDRAYSLMGMLGVRLRADYGEGQTKAISRLFESIIRTTGDVSVFNWAGQYDGSLERGRSMYPKDFGAFIHIVDKARPANALSAVTFDHIGVHARFDIMSIGVEIEGSNARTLRGLDGLLEKTNNRLRDTKNDVLCSCEFIFRDGSTEKVKVLSPLKSLRSVLQGLVNSKSGIATTKWVLARFAGVGASDWFLCETNHASLTAGSSGRRLAMSELPQETLSKARGTKEQILMWIG